MDAMDEFKAIADRMLWSPMETAPTTGEWILIFVSGDDDGETFKVARWTQQGRHMGWTYRGGWCSPAVPDAWMPLPAPPFMSSDD